MFSKSALLFATAATALDTIQYGAFTQTATYSIANQLGFFTAYNLNVVYNQVPNSTYAYATVLNGGYDILTGTIDNAVNYRFNSNETLTVLGQLDQGPDLVLASVENITTVEELEGKPLIVDSPVSGYAYLLQKVLSAYGMYEYTDYYFQTVGGTSLRYADLIAGSLANGSTVYGTILTYPFTAESEVLPEPQRPNILARVSDFVEPISSSAFTVRESAISNSTENSLLTRFIAAMYTANLYLNTAANMNCSIAAIAAQLNVSTTVADLEYSAATNDVYGEISPGGNFTVNRMGLLNIIDIREEFGGFSSLPSNYDFDDAITPGTGKLIDYSIRDQAVASLNSSLLSATC